jgi:hypothetical protein
MFGIAYTNCQGPTPDRAREKVWHKTQTSVGNPFFWDPCENFCLYMVAAIIIIIASTCLVVLQCDEVQS